MNELIKVDYNGDMPTVSGRLLHERLGVETPYRLWFPRMCEYGFAEGVDYTPYIFVHPQNQQDTTDHALTIPMSKEIAMIQRNEKGKAVRQYLIQVEDAWNSPDKIMARALQIAEKRLSAAETEKELLSARITEMRPKEIFADAVSASKTSILVGELAKLLKQNGLSTGQNRFFEWLRVNGFLINRKGSDYNMPTQRSMELGLFEIKETSITHSDGHISISKTPKVTGKGQVYFINRLRQSYAG